MFCFIYKITNTLDGKIYIGQTWQTMQVRLNQHRYKNDSIKLYNAINKYGVSNFIIKCLTITHTQDIADFYEKQFIEKYNSTNRKIGYNISKGGRSVGKHSDSTKKKISQSRKGKLAGIIFTNEHKKKISEAKMGHSVSKETRQKISASNIGKKLSEETKQRIGQGHVGLKYNMKDPETRRKNISDASKIKKFNDGQIIEIINEYKTWEGTKVSLAKKHNISIGYMSKILNGTARKFIKNENDSE